MSRQSSVVGRRPSRIVVLLLTLFPCVAAVAQMPDAAYRAEFTKWQAEQAEDLKKNWLSAVGLYWLKDGESTVGSAKGNTIELPAWSAPARVGVLRKKGSDISFAAADGVKVTSAGKPVREVKLVISPPENATRLEVGPLVMFVIERNGRSGLRVRDPRNPDIARFHGFTNYPLSTAYIVTADFVPAKDEKISMLDVTGEVRQFPSPGEVRFRLNGQQMRLTPIEGEGGGLFIVFSDLTKKKDTYPGGRFLETAAPKDGKVVLDFNRAYSPPCAWTPYATCPLAPKENQLKIEIPAGEKYFGHH